MDMLIVSVSTRRIPR